MTDHVNRAYHEAVIRLLTEERDAAIKRLTQVENRLALIDNVWVEVANSVEITGPIEEGLLAMAREINRYRYPYA